MEAEMDSDEQDNVLGTGTQPERLGLRKLLFLPQLHLTLLCIDWHGGGSGGGSSVFQFYCFPLQAWVSLFVGKQRALSEAGDLCFNFGSQLLELLAPLADLLLFRFLFFWMVVIPSTASLAIVLFESLEHLLIWKMSFLWQPKISLMWLGGMKILRSPVWVSPGDVNRPPGLELGRLLSHLQMIIFFKCWGQ